MVSPPIRPSWWTPEKVLALLQSGEPAPILCRRAAAECDGVSHTALRNDIRAWSKSALYGDDFTTALRLWRKDVDTSSLVLTDIWHDDFFAAMLLDEVGGKIEIACEFVGIGPELVYAKLDRRNKSQFDEDFAERVRVLEGRRFARVRSNVLEQAESPTMDGAKIGLKLLESGMPTLHGARSTLKVEAEVKVEHGLSPEVIAASAARTRTLMAGRTTQAAFPHSRELLSVIDVTPVEEKVVDECG